MLIQKFDFSKDGLNAASLMPKCKDWPVVYLIDGSELYIGETSNFSVRFQQHLDNPARRNLNAIRVVLDETFNKSAILDIEQNLIRLFGSSSEYRLQNMNMGQSASHDYYQREMYRKKIPEIWNQLKQQNVATEAYDDVVNSNLYKYSPYITLTEDQNNVSYEVINYLCDCIEKNINGSAIIEGCAGTGKTILAINMLHTLANRALLNYDVESDDSDKDKWHKLVNRLKQIQQLKIAFVVPMTNLRKTLMQVFEHNCLDNLVLGPSDITRENFDVIFVDESHRLVKRQALASYTSFDEGCKRLHLNPETCTQLDWIVQQSKVQVLFYDSKQSVRSSDITKEEFENAIIDNCKRFYLKSQMRCLGGDSYINHVNAVFDNEIDKKSIGRYSDPNYDVKIFDNPNEMIECIKQKDKEFGLCRNLAGYAWKWKTKKFLDLKNDNSYEEFIEKVGENPGLDIDLCGKKYIWNTCLEGWIISDHAVDEIGCIHTSQGFDLNYVGLIFGPEIDFQNGRLITDKDKFFDRYAKTCVTDDEIFESIIHAYKVMLTRGIRGCYMYACNPGMQNYLKCHFQ